MKRKSKLKKFEYLFRIALSLFLLFFTVISLLYFTIFRDSHNKIIENNYSSYKTANSSFMLYFNEYLNMIKNNANKIAIINEDDPNNRIDKATLETNPYYYFNAVAALSHYKAALYGISDIGLFFEGSDFVLTSSHKYSLLDFERIFAKGEETKAELQKFFIWNDKENYFSSFRTEPYYSAKLMIGYPVIWNGIHKAIFFYVIKHDTFNSALFSPKNSDDAALYIYNENGTLFFANESTDSLPPNFSELNRIKVSDSSKINSLKEMPYMTFACRNETLGKSFVSMFLKDEAEQEVDKFYKNLNKGLLINIFGFLFLFSLTVYINYRPIFKMLKRFKDQTQLNGESEIHTIISTLDEMEFTISEQKVVIKDHIFNNLLNGIDLSESDEIQISSFLCENYYIVFLFIELRMDSQKRKDLILTAETCYNSKLCIVDDLKKNQTAIICAAITEEIFSSLSQFLRKTFSESIMGIGKVVNSYKEISSSYLYAVGTLGDNTYIHSLSEYPEFEIFLRFLKNGEKENALNSLFEMTERIRQDINSVLYQKYICYDIVILYIKCLNQLQYPPSNSEMYDLLSKTDIWELGKYLSISVEKVCEKIALSREEAYNELKSKIIEYIEENLYDSGLCRNQIADKFGISIYSLSRMFKERTNLGVKEFINDKRLETAKNLMLSTERTISDISEGVGFTNVVYFPKLFKLKYGSSPSEYRSKHIGGKATCKTM